MQWALLPICLPYSAPLVMLWRRRHPFRVSWTCLAQGRPDAQQLFCCVAHDHHCHRGHHHCLCPLSWLSLFQREERAQEKSSEHQPGVPGPSGGTNSLGAKILFMCFFFRVIPCGGEKTHKQSPPPKSRDNPVDFFFFFKGFLCSQTGVCPLVSQEFLLFCDSCELGVLLTLQKHRRN